ncbi:MAG: alcohol acetyltransferase [Christensenellaceae bacterium]
MAYKLDTAATIFPAVTRKTNTSIYRVSAVLFYEVVPEVLKRAANAVMVRFPMLKVAYKHDAFDDYFEPNDKPIVVKQETEYPCDLIEPEKNNDYYFQILYYKNRISVEIFHAITDGVGAIEFLKSLIYQYLRMLGEHVTPDGLILLPEDKIDEQELNDGFEEYYRALKTKMPKLKEAFRIKGTSFEPYGHNVIHGIVDVSALKALCKKMKVTITEYLSAALIYSIYLKCVRDGIDTEPIVISVPANLRGLFPTKTIRNFFCIVNISVKPVQNMKFEDILAEVAKQVREKTTKEKLELAMAESLNVTHNPIVKKAPRFLRNAGTKFVFAYFGENIKTMSLSNVGAIQMPKSVNAHIDRIETIIYPTERSPVNCCVCSLENKMTITFIRSIIETDIIKFFFGYLTSQTGVDVELYSNDWGMQL